MNNMVPGKGELTTLIKVKRASGKVEHLMQKGATTRKLTEQEYKKRGGG